MAYFAKIGKGNIVTKVHTLDNSVLLKDGVENEQQGVEFLQNLWGNRDLYIQTSYNGTFRKNYAGVGYKYDQAKDAFIPPNPYPSWVLNEDTFRWNAPIEMPNDDKEYYWDEESTSWKEITE